jgi:hypothetical protein
MQTYKHFHAYFINHLAADLNGVEWIAHKHNSKSLPSEQTRMPWVMQSVPNWQLLYFAINGADNCIRQY